MQWATNTRLAAMVPINNPHILFNIYNLFHFFRRKINLVRLPAHVSIILSMLLSQHKFTFVLILQIKRCKVHAHKLMHVYAPSYGVPGLGNMPIIYENGLPTHMQKELE